MNRTNFGPQEIDFTDSAVKAFIEKAYHRLSGRCSLASLTRAEWRSSCRGQKERTVFQKLLVELAYGATEGSRSDQLALLYGAHAVLPLDGAPLRRLALLLAETHSPRLEDADIFLAAIEAHAADGALIRPCLAALESICERLPPGSSRASWLCYCLKEAGITASWLDRFVCACTERI